MIGGADRTRRRNNRTAVIVFICPMCKSRLTVGDDRAGDMLECPRCDAEITVPLPPISTSTRAGPPPVPSPPAGRDDEDEEPVVEHRYVYKMVQMPPNIQIEEGTSTKGVAARYLSDLVNDLARKGWEFFRVDQIGIQINPGCLSGLLGARANTIIYYVVTFRRPA